MNAPASLSLLVAGLLLASTFAKADEATSSNPQVEAFFEDQVRPLLVTRCEKCHSISADVPGGNLLLDSREGWQRGGDLGQAVVPGDMQSLVLRAVRYQEDSLQMPPDGKLSPAEIRVLEKWIQLGAYDPRSSTVHSKAKKLAWEQIDYQKHWAFAKLEPFSLTVPIQNAVVANNQRVSQSWIDDAMHQHWSRNGVTPTEPADRFTLLRRMYFDLTGLPPEPYVVQQYLSDTSPWAFRKQAARLLASPEYGERWGRHWLDVARYSDSNGSDENVAHGTAWRYRNYVLNAFNRDLPFDQFVREQIAGDLINPSEDIAKREQQIIATGFLSLGPKVLAEVDEAKMEWDIIDEQIETIGKAFLGLTLGCARCHDHKFDPITQADYYALAGVFKSTRTMEHFKKIAKWNEVIIATPEERQAFETATRQAEELKTEIDISVRVARAELATQLKAGEKLEEPVEPKFPQPVRDRLEALRAQHKSLVAAIPELPAAMAVSDLAAYQDVPVLTRGNPLLPARVVPRGVPVVFASKSTRTSHRPKTSKGFGRLELADWLSDSENPLTSRVIVNRVWRWHFGRGLVETVDNFGLQTPQPALQPVLDRLAQELIDSEWSIKRLHLEILGSATYQLSSHPLTENANIDPDNHSFWRATPRRLEAESIRDGVLQLSQTLDRRHLDGTLLKVKNRQHIFDHTSKDATTYDVQQRSVYLPIVRNHLFDLFRIFDFADANVGTGDRVTSTGPSQSLYLLNSPFMIDAATRIAKRTESQGSEAERCAHLYEYVMSRPMERALEEPLLQSLAIWRSQLRESGKDPQSATDESWAILAHTLLLSNQWIYVR